MEARVMDANQVTYTDSVNNCFAVVVGTSFKSDLEASSAFEEARTYEVKDSQFLLDLVVDDEIKDSFCITQETAEYLSGTKITLELLNEASEAARSNDSEILSEYLMKTDHQEAR